jgi:hypothetical protein
MGLISALRKIFGGGNRQPAAPTPVEAIQKLRETKEMLVKKQDFLEKKVRFLSFFRLNISCYNFIAVE